MENGHARPDALIGVRLQDIVLAFQVRLIVRQQHVFVTREQRIDERVEKSAVAVRNGSGTDEVERLAQLRI
jgi:hypothetical protein